jgi:hypothetical protein
VSAKQTTSVNVGLCGWYQTAPNTVKGGEESCQNLEMIGTVRLDADSRCFLNGGLLLAMNGQAVQTVVIRHGHADWLLVVWDLGSSTTETTRKQVMRADGGRDDVGAVCLTGASRPGMAAVA